MNPRPILVVADAPAQVETVVDLLRAEFRDVHASTHPERAVEDFDRHRPAVLVVAFDTLEKAERYCLRLYRLGTLAHELPHRTLVVCSKDDVRRAYELCKAELFDDYILFWPLNHDAPRLAMAVHHALRAVDAMRGPSGQELALHARRIAAQGPALVRSVDDGEARVAQAGRAIAQARAGIGEALDGLARSLDGDAAPTDEVRRRFDRVRADAVEPGLAAMAGAIEPVHAWTGTLRHDLAPALAAAQSLEALAHGARPLVLVVDDDAFQCRLLARMFPPEDYETATAATAGEAFAMMRSRLPALVLMDVNLPDIDGVEATRRLKSIGRYARIPILMVTGHSGRDVVLDSIRAGATDFLVKPVDRFALLDKVRRTLDAVAAA